MAKIAKADYFAGVFLSTILKSSKTVPMLCDASKDVKRVLFDTDVGDFNVYVKYAATFGNGWDYTKTPKVKRLYWNVPFTPTEYKYIVNMFPDPKKSNILAIICTNSKFSSSWIAILSYTEMQQCLSASTENGMRRITVSRSGKEHRFSCFGVNGSYDEPVASPYVNHLRFFDSTVSTVSK